MREFARRKGVQGGGGVVEVAQPTSNLVLFQIRLLEEPKNENEQ